MNSHQHLHPPLQKRLTYSLEELRREIEALDLGYCESSENYFYTEAHNMVREANEKQAAAEKALKESEMKVEMLMAEVSALKTMVITSTPSTPNPHLHPQINRIKEEVLPSEKHHLSSSHSQFFDARSDQPPTPNRITGRNENMISFYSELEVEPELYDEFISWKERPELDKTAAFISRVYDEDINLCLSFTNSKLSEKIMDSVEKGTISIEALGDNSKNFERYCALLTVPKICSHRMNLGEENDNWYNISQICRNRITAVCDFLNYLKYIERGLVKSSARDMFREVMRLRRNMVLGRMGYPTHS